VIVGEAPGRTEDEGGEPFIGRSGQLLFSLLAAHTGITREQCYVTNVVKCRPPNNRPPRLSEIEACRPWWREQRDLLSPRVILTLGNTATRAILERRVAITNVHGQVFECAGSLVVPTFHPAAVLRGRVELRDHMITDLLRVSAVLVSGS